MKILKVIALCMVLTLIGKMTGIIPVGDNAYGFGVLVGCLCMTFDRALSERSKLHG